MRITSFFLVACFVHVYAETSSPNSHFSFRSASPEIPIFSAAPPISGVLLAADGSPLVGASITVRGSSTGTTTNESGRFTLNRLADDAVLVISSLGYETITVPVSAFISRDSYTGANGVKARKETNGSFYLTITMNSTSAKMDEVVVTGYQNKKKSEYAGAATTVKAKDIKVPSLGTLDKMLQGQVAGVAVQTTSSVFGTAPKIRVRGSASLSGINEPLWVLDGVPLEAPLNIVPSELYAGNARNLLASALSNVNPEDIEDITVLKDATATAMYGTRAVNGVIVVNTKRAKKSTPLRVNYSFNTTLSLKPSILDFDVLNSKDQIELNEELYEIYQASLMNFSADVSGPYSKLLSQYNTDHDAITNQEFREGVRDLKTVNTDWFDALYRNTFMHQHSVSLSKGGKKNAVRLSFSYYGDPGKTIGENVRRLTGNLVDNLQITDKLSAEVMLKYARRDQRNAGTGINPFTYARDASRAMKPYADNGDYEYYKRGFADFNVINELKNNYISLNNDDYLAQANIMYKVTDRIKFSTLFSYRYANSTIDEIQNANSNYANQFRADLFRIKPSNERLYKSPGAPSWVLPETVLPAGGILDEDKNESRFFTFREQSEWNVLNKTDHKLDIMAGIEVTQNKQSSYFKRNYGYLGEGQAFAPSPLAYERLTLATSLPNDETRMYNGRNLLQGVSEYPTEYKRNAVSFYSSLSYSFKAKYIFDASLRNDATNVSGRASRNRFLPTWAIGGAWIMSSEDFMSSFNHIFSDVKLRVSYGLRGNAGYRGPDLVAYEENILRLYPAYNTTGINILESENSSLEFEKEYMFSTGIDFSLFKKADFTLNYYSRKNFDLVGYRPVQSSAGYLTKLFNWADMKNEGIEASVNLRPVKITKDLSWSIVFNLGYNKNTVLSDYQGNFPSVYTASNPEGFPLIGKPLTGMYSFSFAGLNNRGLPQYYTSKGTIVTGFNESERELPNVVYEGSRDPLYSGGFASNFMYKNLTLGVSFVFNAGHVVRKADYYRGGTISGLYRDDMNASGDYAYRWRATGDEKFTAIPRLILQDDINDYNNDGFFNTSIFTTYNNSDIRTINASYLRLRNITLQYNFQKLAQRAKMQNFTLGMEASNLAVFASKRLNGMDPETLLTGLNMPPVRSFTLSLSATF